MTEAEAAKLVRSVMNAHGKAAIYSGTRTILTYQNEDEGDRELIESLKFILFAANIPYEIKFTPRPSAYWAPRGIIVRLL